MTVEELTSLLVSRIPEVPRSALAALAESVSEMCQEARDEEREACAKIAEYLELDDPGDWEARYATACQQIAAAIRARKGTPA